MEIKKKRISVMEEEAIHPSIKFLPSSLLKIKEEIK